MFWFQLLRRCRAAPSFSMISYNNYEYVFRHWRGAWTLLGAQPSVRGGLCIFGDVCMHALCVHVWNRMQKLCFIVFSLLFVRPHIYM